MAQKIVGYREMIWTCPNCGAKNPGSSRTCKSCGASMGDDVIFEQSVNASMIKDQATIERAKTGPDVYCAYCGNRNPAGTKTCLRCGADLSEGHEREHGAEYSAHIDETDRDDALVCPSCGAVNSSGAMKCAACGSPLNVSVEKEPIPSGPQNTASGQKKGCSRGCIMIIIILVLIGILGPILFNGMGILNNYDGGGRTPVPTRTPIPNSVVNAIVQSQTWQTSVQLIGLVDKQASAWEDQIPDGARNIRCEDRKRYTSDEEVENSIEVCGEEYTIDLGNGYEQVTQDCVYEVYDSYCQFTVSQSGIIDTRRASGTGPDVQLPNTEGYETTNQTESYSILLVDENGREYRVTPSNLREYRSYNVGDEFKLEVNSRGTIVNMERK